MKKESKLNDLRRSMYQLMVVIILTLAGSFCLTANAQNVTVSGSVKNTEGEPIPGTTVVVKGTTTGTITDSDGNYSINSVPDDATLQFSFVGMKTQEVVAAGKTNIDVVMEEEAIGIEEVVAVGYGSMRKMDVTGAIASVGREDILSNPSMNAVQSIQGKIPGVDIYSTGHKPGDAPSIRIRGNRSINASNSPLYVVDGIAFEGDLRDINSSDIVSIDILKDASATAIYGSRGANGVVLVTTRRGKEGVAKVSYDGYYGIEIDNKLNMMTGAEIAEFRRESRRNAGRYDSDSPVLELDENMFYYPDKYVIESVSAGYDENGTYNPSKVKSYDWIDAITRLGKIQDHQVSILGGNSKTKTSFSAGYFENEGVVRGYGYSKYSLRLTIDQNVKSWFKFGGSIASSFNLKKEPNGAPFSVASITNPLNPFYDEKGVLQLTPGGEIMPNALRMAQHDVAEHKAKRFYGSYFAEFRILESLKYRINFGPDYKTGRSGYFNSSKGSLMGADPRASQSTFNQFHFTLDNLIYFDKTFKNIHKIGITVLQSIEEFKFESMNGAVIGLPYEYQKWFNLGTATSITGLGSNYSQWRLSSFMGRINYNFKEKYLITLTGRYDGSSRLAEGHKYTFFPSTAISWRINEEPFMKSINLFDNLKLRLGYGVTGNTAISPYATLGSLSRVVYASGDNGFLGYAPNALSNTKLGWEKTSQYNLGLDFSVFSSRFSGSVDIYRQNTNDLLLSRALPIASGFSSVMENIGSTRNSGLEISLAGIILNSPSGFKWSTEIVFFANKEEIVELYSGKEDDIGNKWFIGHPINTFYDYKFDGIWQDTDADKALMAKYNENGSNYAPGEIRIYDRDDNETINAEDRIILGTAVPKWTGSLNSRIEYGGFDFSFYAYTRQGQMVINTINAQYEGRYNFLDVDYWTPDNPSNSYPKPVDGRATPLNYSAKLYEDGSFIKLKTVTLGYTLPVNVISKINMSNFRIYITAQNPLMYTKFTGIDPEGASGTIYPSTKAFMFGVSTSF
ncbi:TonB-dependent receptor [Mariniphaga sediminis]|uniref:TonB-dependent receptor n=1 Tax=Mariniphaga sediminis TaxID=1628158 RepID=A0A399D5A6_9BACT|nr:TonB-dependent receptor [Mariniphaga sediminis]RIH67085.1 TonB-dependent receptor [Mariniphaga sediminis]